MTPRVEAPALSLYAMEPASLMEFAAFVTWSPALLLTRFGDGRPVLVLPGFTGSDRSTTPLRATLRNRGFWVHGWRLGSNVGLDGGSSTRQRRVDPPHREQGER